MNMYTIKDKEQKELEFLRNLSFKLLAICLVGVIGIVLVSYLLS